MTTPDTAIAPVVKTVTVACDPETAFRVFTREIGAWWPLEQLSLTGDAAEVVWEEHEGGAIYEVSGTGERASWGSVLTWEPPDRVVWAWHVNRPEGVRPTEVEVCFVSDPEGTRVVLEHRHWDRLPDGAERRDGYVEGWELVLSGFRAHPGLV